MPKCCEVERINVYLRIKPEAYTHIHKYPFDCVKYILCILKQVTIWMDYVGNISIIIKIHVT